MMYKHYQHKSCRSETSYLLQYRRLYREMRCLPIESLVGKLDPERHLLEKVEELLQRRFHSGRSL